MGSRVIVHQDAIDALTRDPDIVAVLLQDAQPVIRDARSRAPKRTGAGAESIDAQPYAEPGGEQTVRVGWDRNHFYMGFHDLGTSQLPALHFLEDALEANLI